MKSTRHCRPNVEVLEDRRLMATKVSLSGSTLKFVGDNTFNRVVITQSDDPNNPQLIVKVDQDDEIVFDSKVVTTIQATLAGGNDEFDYFLDPNFDYVFAKSITVDLGAGRRNKADFEMDLVTTQAIQADLTIRVTGGVGADDCAVNFTKTENANINVRADMGAGDDIFLCRVNGDSSSASGGLLGKTNVNILANGGSGRDRLDVELGHDDFSQGLDNVNWEGVKIDTDATFFATLNGDTDNDRFVGMRFRGQILGSLIFRADGGAGVDQMLYSAATDDANNPSTGKMDAVINGGDDADVMKMYFRNQRLNDDILNPNDVNTQMSFINLFIDGGAGRDGFWRGGNNIGRPFIKMKGTEYVATPPPVIY